MRPLRFTKGELKDTFTKLFRSKGLVEVTFTIIALAPFYKKKSSFKVGLSQFNQNVSSGSEKLITLKCIPSVSPFVLFM